MLTMTMVETMITIHRYSYIARIVRRNIALGKHIFLLSDMEFDCLTIHEHKATGGAKLLVSALLQGTPQRIIRYWIGLFLSPFWTMGEITNINFSIGWWDGNRCQALGPVRAPTHLNVNYVDCLQKGDHARCQ